MVHLQDIKTVPAGELQLLADNNAIAARLRDVFPYPYTLENAQDFLQLAGQGVFGHVSGIFAAETFIGVGSIVPGRDIYRHNGEIGYWIGEPYWGKGYGSEAVRLLTCYAFEELGLLRVFAGVFADNNASMKVLEKSGYKLEAVLKSAIVKQGVIMDEYLYSILKA